LRSPALITASSKAGCYAVLASLSGRYPPLEGRSPTCYSPVCHSTHPFRDFRVRLACVRHAASVDSEPGSNSHVKLAAHRRPPSHLAMRRRGSGESNSFNARPINWLLRCSVRCLNRGSSPAAFARTDSSGRPIPRCHALTLSHFSMTGLCCACTHYLVFKEPTIDRQALGSPRRIPAASRSGSKPTAFRGTF
jgi:hypothetical protein